MKTFKEFFTLGVNKPTKDQIQDYLNRLGSSVRLLSNKDLIRSIERYFKTIKNLKLDHSGRKVLAFEEVCCDDCYDHIVEESEYQGKKVKLNDPIRTNENPKKKFKVYVKNAQGKVVVVRFGDPNMEIKRDDPKRRAAFRARHNCDDKKDKTTPGYWSCMQWRAGAKVDN
tara:strand:+ start:109 stop:618 length:510 start_codon:yes stop_codon:yes gene_type:complete